MDAAGQRQSKVALGRLNHHRDGLTRVAEDKLRLGIVLRFLVQLFDRRHLESRLGRLEAIGEQDGAPVDQEELPLEDPEHKARPQGRELGHSHRRAVEEIHQSVIELAAQAERAHKARDAIQIATDAECRQDSREPEKGAVAAKSWAQSADEVPPGEP